VKRDLIERIVDAKHAALRVRLTRDFVEERIDDSWSPDIARRAFRAFLARLDELQARLKP
jgi:hypothetical protein